MKLIKKALKKLLESNVGCAVCVIATIIIFSLLPKTSRNDVNAAETCAYDKEALVTYKTDFLKLIELEDMLDDIGKIRNTKIKEAALEVYNNEELTLNTENLSKIHPAIGSYAKEYLNQKKDQLYIQDPIEYIKNLQNRSEEERTQEIEFFYSYIMAEVALQRLSESNQ